MNKYGFPDYSLHSIFKNIYAIEPEISKTFWKENLSNEAMYEESSTIAELVGLHTLEVERIQEIYHKVKEFYKDKFPIGSDRKVSGGVHFHLFKGKIRDIDGTALKLKLLNLPLFCKVSNNKIYARNNTGYWYLKDNIDTDCKSSGVTYKEYYWTHGHSRQAESIRNHSLEFRCNNVFDARLYGYYVGIIIASEENVLLKKTSLELRDYICKGNQGVYSEKDIELKHMGGYRISEEDISAIRINSTRIIKLLEKHGLIESAIALKEYLNEVGIKTRYEVTHVDSFTLEKIKNPIRIESFKLLKVDTGTLYFANENNFYDFIKQKLKELMKASGVPLSLVDISDKSIIKKYSELTVNKPSEEIQGTLFTN